MFYNNTDVSFLYGNPTSIVNGSVQQRSQEKTTGLFVW